MLAVDDEEDIRASIKELLELSLGDVEVVAAADGREALDRLADGPIDLILTDCKMPVMDGLEFLARVQQHPEIPRLMLTASPDPELAARAVKETGVGLFIAKPFDMDYLIDVVTTVLRKPHVPPPRVEAGTS